jgi:hypothetical protein
VLIASAISHSGFANTTVASVEKFFATNAVKRLM